MQPIRRRLVLFPQRGLRFVSVPGVLLAGDVGIEQWLVLELVPAEPPRERILGPDDLTAHFETSLLKRVLKLPLPGRGMAHIKRSAWFDDGAVGSESISEEALKLLPAHAVALNRQPIFGIALIVDVIRRICKDHIGSVGSKHPRYTGCCGC